MLVVDNSGLKQNLGADQGLLMGMLAPGTLSTDNIGSHLNIGSSMMGSGVGGSTALSPTPSASSGAQRSSLGGGKPASSGDVSVPVGSAGAVTNLSGFTPQSMGSTSDVNVSHQGCPTPQIAGQAQSFDPSTPGVVGGFNSSDDAAMKQLHASLGSLAPHMSQAELAALERRALLHKIAASQQMRTPENIGLKNSDSTNQLIQLSMRGGTGGPGAAGISMSSNPSPPSGRAQYQDMAAQMQLEQLAQQQHHHHQLEEQQPQLQQNAQQRHAQHQRQVQQQASQTPQSLQSQQNMIQHQLQSQQQQTQQQLLRHQQLQAQNMNSHQQQQLQQQYLNQQRQRPQLQQHSTRQHGQPVHRVSTGPAVADGSGVDTGDMGSLSGSGARPGNGVSLSGEGMSETALGNPAAHSVAAPTLTSAVGAGPDDPLLPGGPPRAIMNPGTTIAGGCTSSINTGTTVIGDGTTSSTPGSFAEEPVWRGSLNVSSHQNNMLVPCVALKHSLAGRSSIQSTESWPSSLGCVPDVIKKQSDIQHYISDVASQWYVRFVPVDNTGRQRDIVQKLVQVLTLKKMVFEIACNGGSGQGRGKLYLVGTTLSHTGPSLIGIFRPDPPQRVDEVALMSSLIGS
jgi:hypothetical protein